MTSSDNPSPSVTSRLQHLSITTDPATTGIAGDPHTVASSPGHTQFFNATQGKPGNEATRTVFHSSSANTGQLFTLPPPVDDNTTTHFSQGTGSFRYTEYPQPNSMVLEQIHAQSVCTPTQGSISTEPSGSTSHLHLNKTQTHDKPTDGHGNVTASSNNNMAMSTSMRMPTERTIPVSPNPPTASAWLIKEGGSNGPGVSESQTTAPGSDSLVYDHSVMRSPSLRSESSIESTDDSAEVDPIQASEQSEGAMFTITSGGLKPASCSKSGGGKRKRQRCEHCVKYKKESNDLKKELVELQRTLSREREQSNVQVAGFREEIYRVEQQANYEIAQCQIHIVRDAELRHHDASRIIQKLQRELQLVEKERDGFKNAYDSCLERCQMLQAELQRVDSMQCPDYCYEQYDNAIAPYPHNFNNYSAHTQEDSQVYGRLQQHP